MVTTVLTIYSLNITLHVNETFAYKCSTSFKAHTLIIYQVKVKFSHTRYWALGSELIPVYRQSADRWLFNSSPAVGCHYFPPGLQSLSQPKNVTVLRPVPSLTAWWHRHIGVNNLPKVVMQLCPDGNWTPWPTDCKFNAYSYATVPPIYKGYTINEFQNGIILLIFMIWIIGS